MSPRERIEEGLREVGVLLIAFSPFDAVLEQRDEAPLRAMMGFLTVGLALFIVAVVHESRRR